jgi:hypothetical protein
MATATTSAPESVSVADLRKVLEAIPPEPFRELMREQGFLVSDGWKMAVPQTAVPPDACLPDYVVASPYTTRVVFFKILGTLSDWSPSR